MEIARSTPLVHDFDAELLAAYPGLARRLTLILGNAADGEDIAQSAFARAIEPRRHFRGGDTRAWLFTIGIRLALNELERRRPTVSIDRLTDESWAMRSDPDLWQALEHLEPRPRAALLLSVIDGYTHDEIGRMLDAAPGTVSSWLSRSKARLRTALAQDER